MTGAERATDERSREEAKALSERASQPRQRRGAERATDERSREEAKALSDQPSNTTSAEPTAISLPGEHAVLSRDVRDRAEAVLHGAEAGRWPAHELAALVDYLQLEVLRQIVDEEWLLFRTARESADQLDRLRQDHVDLRLRIDQLTLAASGARPFTPAQLAGVVRDLLGRLDDHLANEEQLLANDEGPTPSTAALGSQPHEWYELTEGPVIDLDRLPGPHGADAAAERLLRLRPGERVELHSSTDPGPVWRHVWRTDPAAFGVSYLEQGPPRWRVEITRRPPESALSPSAG